MNIELTGRHIEITEAIRDHIQKRVAKLSKLVGGLCDFHFVLTVEKHRQIAEVNLVTKMGIFSATEESKDLYGSIGSAVEKLEKQIRKFKERRKDMARSNDKERLTDLYVRPAVTDLGSPADMAANPEIVDMVMDPRPMAIEEAIGELKESGGSFVVFVNSATDNINILYRRRDGNFGLIRP